MHIFDKLIKIKKGNVNLSMIVKNLAKRIIDFITDICSKNDNCYKALITIMPSWYENRLSRKLESLSNLKRFYMYRENYVVENYKQKQILELKISKYDYNFFHVAFLNEVMSFCLMAVTNGYIPRIKILTKNGDNLWEWYFEQPFKTIDEEKCSINAFQRPNIFLYPEWSYSYDKTYVNLFGYLYKEFVKLNFKTEQYINQEKKEILQHGRMLGVLCRGTDYLSLAPKGHPVQPSEEEIVETVRKVMNNGYDSIYLATEDSRYKKLLERNFKKELIYTNKSNYYDKTFYENKCQLIGDVHFDRENDDYLKGLEYLSSLKILSECSGFVGGNCGGTQAAIFFNGGRYKDCVVFDHGLY